MISKQLFFASLKNVGPLLRFPRTWVASVDPSSVIWHHRVLPYQACLAEYVHSEVLHHINVLWYTYPFFQCYKGSQLEGGKLTQTSLSFAFSQTCFFYFFFFSSSFCCSDWYYEHRTKREQNCLVALFDAY